MRVILLHGKNAGPSDKWYPWFKQSVEDLGYRCDVPELPDSTDPVMSEWLQMLKSLAPDEETVLIGHSRGGVAVLRYLEGLAVGERVKAVILVAANDGRRSYMAIPTETNFGFYTETGYDFAKIKTHCDSFHVLHSTDDEWVPYKAGEENAAGLGVEVMRFSDRGHFGRLAPKVPELIEILQRL